MTKQDKDSAKVGHIKIGGGFSGKIKLRRYDYPPDRLTEFLRLDCDNRGEVYKFCTSYQLIIPSIMGNELLTVFKEQQLKLRIISQKLFGKKLLDISEVDDINSQLAKIKLEVGYPAGNNTSLQNTPKDIREQFREYHLSLYKRHQDALAGLWEDLVTHFVTKQDLKKCINCGDLFVRLSRHEKLYCSDECSNALKQTRHREKFKK